jgi:hypothetical protein
MISVDVLLPGWWRGANHRILAPVRLHGNEYVGPTRGRPALLRSPLWHVGDRDPLIPEQVPGRLGLMQ